MFLQFDEGFTSVVSLRTKKQKHSGEERGLNGLRGSPAGERGYGPAGKWPGELKNRMDRFAVLLEAERKGALDCQNAETIKDVEAGLRQTRRDSAGSAGSGIADYLEQAKARS